MLIYDFSKRGAHPLYEYLYHCLKEDILSGRIPAGTKLPSKRELASDNQISVRTVMNAYDQLLTEGYITSEEKRGYFAAELETTPEQTSFSMHSSFAQVPEEERDPEDSEPLYKEDNWYADFTSNNTIYEKFPFSLWRKTMITQYLPKAVANGTYMKARDKMAYGQYLAGIAFNNASLGYVHAMAHQLGGFYNLPHGVCNAILLPHVEEFNLIGNANRFRNIAKAMGENIDGLSTMDAARKAIAAIRQISEQVGIPKNLRGLGVKEKYFGIMAENAMKDVCQLTNPRKASKEQVIGIFKAAY